MTKKFRSKIDWWILLLLIFVLATQIVVAWQVIADFGGGTQAWAVIAILVLVFLLVLSVLFGTSYRVDRKDLRIASGPFRWRIKLAEISSIAETRNPLSSPALSLDRVRINYGKRRWVMVSPADKEGFYAAIGHSPAGD